MSDREVVNNFVDIYTHSGRESVFDIQPASVLRQWMDETTNQWAYNCLPLKIANQYGWVAHSPCTFSVTWNGGQGKSDVVVEADGCGWPQSHFHHGILTINTDFLIRTSLGTSLYVRGFTNYQKDLIYPMDAIIETDWLPFHFPFSYRFLKPGTAVFEKGEPLFMFFPIERGYVETFEVNFKSMDSNEELKEQNRRFSESRGEHMANRRPEAQKFYIKGAVVDEKAEIEAHRVKLKLNQPKVVE